MEVSLRLKKPAREAPDASSFNPQTHVVSVPAL